MVDGRVDRVGCRLGLPGEVDGTQVGAEGRTDVVEVVLRRRSTVLSPDMVADDDPGLGVGGQRAECGRPLLLCGDHVVAPFGKVEELGHGRTRRADQPASSRPSMSARLDGDSVVFGVDALAHRAVSTSSPNTRCAAPTSAAVSGRP